MSTGDDDPTDEPEPTGDDANDELPEATFADQLDAATTAIDNLTEDDVDDEQFTTALDAVESAIGAAETEADLDQLDTALDDTETALETAELPAPEDDEAADPNEEIQSRIDSLRDTVADNRGPYTEDIIEPIDAARTEITDTRWTESGEADLHTTVSTFIDTINTLLDSSLETDADDLAGSLEATTTPITTADLDADEDRELLANLLAATEELTAGVTAAQAWTDLTTREQLDAEGFYDVLEHRKDYPPEWHALKLWEQQGNTDMIILALDSLGIDFMEEHCLDALKRLGDPAALEPMLERADRRDQPAIEILGKIADDRAVETIIEYVDTDSDPQLQKKTLKALGEIGSTDATQAVANKLESDNPLIRSSAVRALGLIGDPRAIRPLSNTLEADESETVRAGAAWALNQIGTQHALDVVADYADDRSYLVQTEAEYALTALNAQTA